MIEFIHDPSLIQVHILHPDVNWGEFAAKICSPSIGAKTTLPASYHQLSSSRNVKRYQWWDTLTLFGAFFR